MNQKIAEIRIDLYQKGLRACCEELEMDTFCENGNELMEFLNEVQESTDPDITYKLTEKGMEYIQQLEKALKEEENDTPTK